MPNPFEEFERRKSGAPIQVPEMSPPNPFEDLERSKLTLPPEIAATPPPAPVPSQPWTPPPQAIPQLEMVPESGPRPPEIEWTREDLKGAARGKRPFRLLPSVQQSGRMLAGVSEMTREPLIPPVEGPVGIPPGMIPGTPVFPLKGGATDVTALANIPGSAANIPAGIVGMGVRGAMGVGAGIGGLVLSNWEQQSPTLGEVGTVLRQFGGEQGEALAEEILTLGLDAVRLPAQAIGGLVDPASRQAWAQRFEQDPVGTALMTFPVLAGLARAGRPGGPGSPGGPPPPGWEPPGPPPDWTFLEQRRPPGGPPPPPPPGGPGGPGLLVPPEAIRPPGELSPRPMPPVRPVEAPIPEPPAAPPTVPLEELARANVGKRLAERRADAAERAAQTDPLTGVGNRASFDAAKGRVDSDPSRGWVAIDVNNLKAANDLHPEGHSFGDRMIQKAVEDVRATLQEEGIASNIMRTGGDEFFVEVPANKPELAVKIEARFGDVPVGDQKVSLTAAFGPTAAEADAATIARKPSRRVPYRQTQPETPPGIPAKEPPVEPEKTTPPPPPRAPEGGPAFKVGDVVSGPELKRGTVVEVRPDGQVMVRPFSMKGKKRNQVRQFSPNDLQPLEKKVAKIRRPPDRGADWPRNPLEDPGGLADYISQHGGLSDTGEARLANENYPISDIKIAKKSKDSRPGHWSLVKEGGRNFDEWGADLFDMYKEFFRSAEEATKWLLEEWATGGRRDKAKPSIPPEDATASQWEKWGAKEAEKAERRAVSRAEVAAEKFGIDKNVAVERARKGSKESIVSFMMDEGDVIATSDDVYRVLEADPKEGALLQDGRKFRLKPDEEIRGIVLHKAEAKPGKFERIGEAEEPTKSARERAKRVMRPGDRWIDKNGDPWVVRNVVVEGGDAGILENLKTGKRKSSSTDTLWDEGWFREKALPGMEEVAQAKAGGEEAARKAKELEQQREQAKRSGQGSLLDTEATRRAQEEARLREEARVAKEKQGKLQEPPSSPEVQYIQGLRYEKREGSWEPVVEANKLDTARRAAQELQTKEQVQFANSRDPNLSETQRGAAEKAWRQAKRDRESIQQQIEDAKTAQEHLDRIGRRGKEGSTSEKKGTILVRLVDGKWVAEHTGAGAREIVELFGDNTIVTPWMQSTPKETVLSRLKELNPDWDVVDGTTLPPPRSGRGGGTRGMPSGGPPRSAPPPAAPPQPGAPTPPQPPTLRPASLMRRINKWFSTDPKAVARRMEMVRQLEKITAAPFRRGLEGRRVLGFFKLKERVIRAKELTDVEVVAHEAGHALQRILFPEIPEIGGFRYKGRNSSVVRRELTGLGKDLYQSKRPAGGYAAEGYAEFIRLWLTNRQQARRKAPAFYDIFSERLRIDDTTMRVAEILDEVAEMKRLYDAQPAAARILSHRREGGPDPVRTTRLGQLAAHWLDNLSEVERAVGKDLKYGLANPLSAMRMVQNVVNRGFLAVERGGGVFRDRYNHFAGLMDELGLHHPDVLDGKISVARAPEVPQTIPQRILSDRFRRFENSGYVERKQGAYYVTAKGKAEVLRVPEKVSDSLADILAPVASDPYDFVGEPRPAFRRLAEFWRDGDNFRDLTKFDLYLIVRHGRDLARRGLETGLDLADIDTVFTELDALPHFTETAKKVTDFRNAQLRNLADAGVITHKLARYLIEKWPNYVPFHRIAHGLLKGETTGKPGGSRIANVINPIRWFKGSGEEILSPIRSIVADSFLLERVRAENEAMEVLARWAEDHHGSGISVEARAPKVRVTKFKVGDIAGQLKDQLEALGVDVSDLDPTQVLKVFHREAWRSPREGAITWFRRGEERTISVSPVELYEQLMGMSAYQTDAVLNILQIPRAALVANATLSPTFGVYSNPFVDSFVSSVTARIGGVNPLSGYRPIWDLVTRGIPSRWRKDHHYQMAKYNGALMGSMMSRAGDEVPYLMRQIERAGLTGTERAKALGKEATTHPFSTLRHITEAIDDAQRTAVYRRWTEVYGQTRGEMMRAGWEATEAPGAIQRGGKLTHSVNRYVAFFRAGVSGLKTLYDRHVEAARNPEHAKRMSSRVFTYIVAPSVAAWALRRLLKREEEWREEYDRNRDSNWLIPARAKGSWIPIRKPREYGLIYGSSVERALDYLATRDSEWADGFAASAVAMLSPNLMPAALEPMVESARNRSYFFGRKIEPESELRTEAFMRWGESTSDSAKLIAEALRKSESLLGDIPGEMVRFGKTREISPRVIDNMLWSYAGGLGTKFILPAMDKVLAETLRDTEFGRRLGIGQGVQRPATKALRSTFYLGPERAGGKIIEEMYEFLGEAEQKEATYKRMLSQEPKTEEESQALEERADEYARKNARWLSHVQTGSVQLIRERLEVLQALARGAFVRGDTEELAMIRRRTIEAIRAARNDMTSAEEDPSWNIALRFDAELSKMRREEGERRQPIASAIHELVHAKMRGDEKAEGALVDFIGELDDQDRQWARTYAKRYGKLQEMDALERSKSKSPKKFRLKIEEKLGLEKAE